MAETENIIIKDTLDGLGTDAYSNYLAHALCLAGSCRLKYNGEERELQAGDLMIVRKGKLVERIRPADDFRVKVIYVTSEFIVLSTPLSNYGMKGQLALFRNPIMKLDAEQRELCRRDFEMVEERAAGADRSPFPPRLADSLRTDADHRLLRFPFPSVRGRQYPAAKRHHHEPLPQHAGERDVPRTPRSELVCRQAVRHAQIPVRSLPQDKRLCRQLLDKPLHRARHLPPAPRQVADLRPHLRPVRFLVACLFQPLRAATSGGKPDGV